MNWLPKNKQKRNQLYLTVAAAVILIGGMAFGLIRPQYQKLSTIRKQTADTQQHFLKIQQVIQGSAKLTNDLAKAKEDLANAESDIATGDVYAWTVDTMRHFKMNYRVELPDLGQPTVGDVDLLPHFPYKQLKFTIHGTGYYHDVGKFIADLENKFPHMRVLNLQMGPAANEGEKLSFSMDVVALVKPTS